MQKQAGIYKLFAMLGGGLVFMVLIFTGMRVYSNMKAVQETPNNDAVMQNVEINLEAIGNSGVTGKAQLVDVNGQTKITITTNAASEIAQPTSVRSGTCGNLGAINYRLTDVVSGNSESTLAPSMHFLHGLGDLAIAVHKSNEESGITIACANLKPAFEKEME